MDSRDVIHSLSSFRDAWMLLEDDIEAQLRAYYNAHPELDPATGELRAEVAIPIPEMAAPFDISSSLMILGAIDHLIIA